MEEHHFVRSSQTSPVRSCVYEDIRMGTAVASHMRFGTVKVHKYLNNITIFFYLTENRLCLRYKDQSVNTD